MKTPRRVFSLNVSDKELADYIEERSSMYPKGVSEYIRNLVLLDRDKWQSMEKLREQALTKLTAQERAALGFGSAR
jgi:hypothetical protein